MYTIKANSRTNHIDGIQARTQSAGTEQGGAVTYYAETSCGALTRGRFADVSQSEDLAEILAAAKLNARINNRKMCLNCENAANEILAQI